MYCISKYTNYSYFSIRQQDEDTPIILVDHVAGPFAVHATRVERAEAERDRVSVFQILAGLYLCCADSEALLQVEFFELGAESLAHFLVVAEGVDADLLLLNLENGALLVVIRQGPVELKLVVYLLLLAGKPQHFPASFLPSRCALCIADSQNIRVDFFVSLQLLIEFFLARCPGKNSILDEAVLVDAGVFRVDGERFVGRCADCKPVLVAKDALEQHDYCVGEGSFVSLRCGPPNS